MDVMAAGYKDQASGKHGALEARVTAHRDYMIARIDDRIYSGFIEHLGRAIYSGI